MRTFIFITLFFLSCAEGSKTLPNSTGKNSEVIFVVDDVLWENSLQQLVETTFCAQINGLGKEELLFKPFQLNNKEFNSILKTHKNIVIISKGVESVLKHNKWAYGQIVSQVNWTNDSTKTARDLLNLRNVFAEKELKGIKSFLAKSSQKNIESVVFNNFGVKLLVPKEYSIIINEESFFWAKYDPPESDEIKNIITFSFAKNSKNLQKEVLSKTDSIFAKYLLGAIKGSYVCIEKQYPPYYFDNTYRGLWRLENGFMGGPFIIKTYSLKTRVIVNIGLVFAPQSTKRRYIKEFEAIL